MFTYIKQIENKFFIILKERNFSCVIKAKKKIFFLNFQMLNHEKCINNVDRYNPSTCRYF